MPWVGTGVPWQNLELTCCMELLYSKRCGKSCSNLAVRKSTRTMIKNLPMKDEQNGHDTDDNSYVSLIMLPHSCH